MRRLNTQDQGFEDAFNALLADQRELSEDVGASTAAILADVRREGDAALARYTKTFDKLDLAATPIRVSPEDVARAKKAVPQDALDALAFARDRIAAFHQEQLPAPHTFTDDTGAELGWRWSPLDAVGLYVPGGQAAYPSSVLMNAVPAKVAGVGRIAMVVPAPSGVLAPIVLAAADLAGIEEMYRVGGAQAVAALAYGTETIAPVDKIVGPGNAYVASAKRQVFGTVGIDMVAGPSEVVVVADDSADPHILAADLLAQAEHDEAAQSILITTDDGLGIRVAEAVAAQLTELPRQQVAEASWRDHGAIITVASLEEAAGLVNRLAPEHLELAVKDPGALADKITHAGAIFLGHDTPEAAGVILSARAPGSFTASSRCSGARRLTRP
ncbi:MAG: histidinol dehydrogenase, partial [Pseudomonadota bacterium]